MPWPSSGENASRQQKRNGKKRKKHAKPDCLSFHGFHLFRQNVEKFCEILA
jgi:hypothetical protein